MNLPRGSATRSRTRSEIDPERSLPLVAISATGTDWPIAAPQAQSVIGTAIAANKIRAKIRAMRDDRSSESLRAILNRFAPSHEQRQTAIKLARICIARET